MKLYCSKLKTGDGEIPDYLRLIIFT